MYRINLTGWGQEYIVGSINEEFFNHFKNNGLCFNDYMKGEMQDELPEHLKEIFDEDRRYNHDDIAHATGAYCDDSATITVVDENENEVYTSKILEYSEENEYDGPQHYSDLIEDVDIVDCDSRYVVIGNEYSKGLYDEFILELNESFDPSKLTILYKCYDECVDLICGIMYDGIELDANGELDTRGKGAEWCVRDNENPLEHI
jgi:hypothetical protein